MIMKTIGCLKLLLIITALRVEAAENPISEARYKLSAGDLLSADAIVDEYHRSHPDDSTYAAAVAWLARGALMLRNEEAASQYLAQAKAVTAHLLQTQNVKDDPLLANAVGATIEVEARLLAVRGQRDRAIALLGTELPKWTLFSIQARVQKNLNLLTLEGKPAPALPEQAKGKPVLLFLWAHWCSDCKAEGPVIARVWKQYQPRGLVVLAPTRRYGTVHDKDNATSEEEDREIEAVWKDSYAGLADVGHPVSDEIMRAYGVSSTPTLVLIDRNGTVRMYKPFRMSDANLESQVERVLAIQPSIKK